MASSILRRNVLWGGEITVEWLLLDSCDRGREAGFLVWTNDQKTPVCLSPVARQTTITLKTGLPWEKNWFPGLNIKNGIHDQKLIFEHCSEIQNTTTEDDKTTLAEKTNCLVRIKRQKTWSKTANWSGRCSESEVTVTSNDWGTFSAMAHFGGWLCRYYLKQSKWVVGISYDRNILSRLATHTATVNIL